MYSCIIEIIKRVGERYVARLCRASYRFPGRVNKVNNTGALMQDSIYHMTLKLHLICDFRVKTSRFRNVKKVICIFTPLVDYRF